MMIFWFQECKGEKIPNTDGRSKVDVTPFIPLRFIRVDGEDYGRGYVEEYRGDLISLESLMQAIIEGALPVQDIIFSKSKWNYKSFDNKQSTQWSYTRRYSSRYFCHASRQECRLFCCF